MKIGVLTFHEADNYGAVLQAYALKESVKQMGNDVEILNYKQPYILDEYKLFRKNGNENFKSFIYSVSYNLLYLYPRINKKNKFKQFRDNYMDISKEIFKTSHEIKRMDAYIVGSDQVWNSEITKNDRTFYLDFCNNEAKRISYAASFGKDTFSTDEEKFVKDNISNIKYISVREDSGLKLINKLIGKDVEHVLDPTFLLKKELWSQLTKKVENKYNFNYLLIYRLTENKEVYKIAKKIAERLNLEVLYINDSYKKDKYGFKKVKNVGPLEFIDLFKNASFVVTNSFHGTAFSVIFGKDFVSIPHETRGTRMTSLLNLLNLNERIHTNSEKINDINLKIDYEKTNEILESERETSLAFLYTALREQE